MSPDLFYQIALRQTPSIGNTLSRHLYNHFGSAKAVFEAALEDLVQVQSIGAQAAKKILAQSSFPVAEKELQFIQKNNIQTFLFNDPKYPKRLQFLEDAPFLLYFKGNAPLDHPKIISVIGTRHPTERGQTYCDKLVEDLKFYNPLIMSGLAYGIDIAAHKKSLALGIPTVGVVAHGLDRIYPHTHAQIAEQMLENGGILTEFISETEPAREHFPMRNRIIAGAADAVVVVETARSGGSIITAELANEYQKDVFAIPGRLEDEYSQGCNWLIKTHKASLIEQAEDIAYILRWEKSNQPIPTQKQLFVELSEEERRIMDKFLAATEPLHLDFLMKTTAISTSRLAALLLELEFKGMLKPLPGKFFRKI
jgi:DNA processing protein